MESAPGTGCAIGVDVGGTKIEAILLDAAGGEMWRRRVPTPAGDYDGTIGAITDLVRAARDAAGGRPVTIGLGTPGSATADGRMKNANSTCLNGRYLQRDLESALGQRVRMANDANCLALSEATDGAAAGAPVVFAIILGTGCGGGIAVHGRVLTGPNGLAGEWGHNPLPWREPSDPMWDCYCGRRGCTESLLGGPGMARDHAECNGCDLTAAAIAAGAAAGDPACVETLARYTSRLARALAAVVNLLDPDVIVAGGGISRIASLYRDVPELWRPYVFSAGSGDRPVTRFVQSRHGDSSGVRGAAWLWR